MIKINSHIVTPTIFPDKTSQVWKIDKRWLELGYTATIYWKFESEDELIHVCQLTDLVRKELPKAVVTLAMPYLPYARQDKGISNENTFALHTFATLINAMNYTKVWVTDVHSSKAESLINNLENIGVIYNILNVKEIIEVEGGNPIYFGYPDAGAKDRYDELINGIIGDKVRDQDTGWITDYKLNGNPNGKSILMIDDICDGGMTFKLMAKALYENGAKDVHLYVSHGIFSKGIETLRESRIKRIFTMEKEVK